MTDISRIHYLPCYWKLVWRLKLLRHAWVYWVYGGFWVTHLLTQRPMLRNLIYILKPFSPYPLCLEVVKFHVF